MTMEPSLRVALAAPRFAPTLDEGVRTAVECIGEAAAAGAHLVCFPESYLPGIRGQEFHVPDYGAPALAGALDTVRAAAGRAGVTTILPMDWVHGGGRYNVAVVISHRGAVLGCQAKNQIPVEEEPFYLAGHGRRMFEANGVPFGVVICHEGWRYPETVRWAAMRGAKIVFHPFFAGSDVAGPPRTQWGEAGAPFYERAMQMRSLENTIFFASVNYGLRHPEAATSLLSPAGECIAHVPYGEAGMIVRDLDLSLATGLLASRYRPERCTELRPATAAPAAVG